MSSDPLVRRSPTPLRYPKWQRPYRAALLEVNPKKLANCQHSRQSRIVEQTYYRFKPCLPDRPEAMITLGRPWTCKWDPQARSTIRDFLLKTGSTLNLRNDTVI